MKDKEEDIKVLPSPLGTVLYTSMASAFTDLRSRDLYILYAAVSYHSDTVQIVQKGAKNSQNFIF